MTKRVGRAFTISTVLATQLVVGGATILAAAPSTAEPALQGSALRGAPDQARVSLLVRDGKLTLSGDRHPQHVVISSSAQSIRVRVTGPGTAIDRRFSRRTVKRIKCLLRAGDDVVRVSGKGKALPRMTIDAGPGNDRLRGGDSFTRLFGRNGDDVLRAGSGNSRMEGGKGNDVLAGGSGTARMSGDDGRDVMKAGAGAASMDGGSGGDTMTGGGGLNQIFGRSGDDSITGGSGPNRLFGGNDNDVVTGGSGENTMTGDAGTDTLVAGVGRSYMDGGADNDVLRGGPQPATLLGGLGDDTLQGGQAKDLVNGGAGADRLLQSPGGDTLAGSDGNDTYVLDGDEAAGTLQINEAPLAGLDTVTFSPTAARSVTFDMSTTQLQSVTPSLSLRLNSALGIDDVVGGALADTLIGNQLSNSISGGGGVDSFVHHGLGDGVDTFNDLVAPEQIHFLRSGATLEASALTLDASAQHLRDVSSETFGADFPVPVLVSGGSYVFADTNQAPAPVGRLLTYSGTADFTSPSDSGTLIASYLASGIVLSGGAGADRIIDYSANANNLVGGDGQDALVAGAGADVLQGDRGTGDGASDTVTGGPGSDTFRFGESGTGTLEPFGNDVVTDFGTGTDTVDLPPGLSVSSGLGTTTVVVSDGTTTYGTIVASNGRPWTAQDFS